jgi:hypothetical protein
MVRVVAVDVVTWRFPTSGKGESVGNSDSTVEVSAEILSCAFVGVPVEISIEDASVEVFSGSSVTEVEMSVEILVAVSVGLSEKVSLTRVSVEGMSAGVTLTGGCIGSAVVETASSVWCGSVIDTSAEVAVETTRVSVVGVLVELSVEKLTVASCGGTSVEESVEILTTTSVGSESDVSIEGTSVVVSAGVST